MSKKLRIQKPFGILSMLVLAMLALAACAPAATPTQSAPPAGAAAPTATVMMAPTETMAPAATDTMAAAPTAMAATAAPASTATNSAAVPATGGNTSTTEATVNVATDPTLGKILVDGKGMTLYVFTKDGPNQSNCTGGCLKIWPPLLSKGSPQAGAGVDQSMLGTTALADGSMIVTYNKMPLYYWAGDTKPGDTNGQGVKNVWFVVSPQGQPVEKPAAAGANNSAQSGVVVNVATDAKLGKILVDGKGMTLYAFMKDEPNKSNCTGNCLKAWPPLLASSAPKAGDGVDQSLLGSTALADGSMIVTYNKMPLYYFAKDAKPGDTTGQDVNSVWYVVSPAGKTVDVDKEDESTSSSENAAQGNVTVNVVNDPKLGQILVDGKGMTLYAFTKDGPNKSNCSAGCLKAWPPLVTKGNPNAGQGVNAALFGTATLADGSNILTYNKMPLYYWAGDTKPGDTSGQGVNNVWYVVSPDGKLVGAESQTGY